MDYICVKLFNLMMRVHIKCFCTFKIHEKNISKLGLIFGLGLISIFRAVFYVIYRFITVPIVFYRCFGLKNLTHVDLKKKHWDGRHVIDLSCKQEKN
jgi:hypothetical protein